MRAERAAVPPGGSGAQRPSGSGPEPVIAPARAELGADHGGAEVVERGRHDRAADPFREGVDESGEAGILAYVAFSNGVRVLTAEEIGDPRLNPFVTLFRRVMAGK